MEDALERYLFCAGFRKMVVRLEPIVVLSYGPLVNVRPTMYRVCAATMCHRVAAMMYR
jgi:hypothetical protein